MKMSSFTVCLIWTGFFALTGATRAAPVASGFHVRSIQSSRTGFTARFGQRAFSRRGMHVVSAFHRNNRLLFRRQIHRFFPAINIVAYGFPLWYPNYEPYPDLSDNGDETDEPIYDYQSSNGLATQQQSQPTQHPSINPQIATVIPSGTSRLAGSSNGGNVYISNGAGGQVTIVTPEPNEPVETRSAPSPLVAPAPPETKGEVLEKFVLLSWLNDAGKDVIFVKNTEAGDVQRITSEPNQGQFQIIAIHPNSDPKLFEAVISNGREQVTVKFHFATPARS